MQKRRAPPCSPWLQHPLPVLPWHCWGNKRGKVTSPPAAPCCGTLGSASCWGCPAPLPGQSGPGQGWDSEGHHRGRGEGVGKGTGCALQGARGEEVLYLIVSLIFEVLELELNEQ